MLIKKLLQQKFLKRFYIYLLANLLRVLNTSDENYKENPIDTISNPSDPLTDDECDDLYQNDYLD